MSDREYHAELAPGHKDLFDWIKPHKPVPDWLRKLPPIEFYVPRWDRRGRDRGACPIVNISDKRRGKWLVRVNQFGLSVRLVSGSGVRTPPGHNGLRQRMAGSLARLGWATHVLESSGVVPTHMLTLTLPPEAWEKRIEELGRDEAVRLFLQARAKFLDALRKRLGRSGASGSWLWFLEFQGKRQAPHVHILLDLGGYLPSEDYRDWVEWVTAEWSRALGVPAPHATRLESLRRADFRYVRKYASKATQKEFPFPAKWGRSWDVAGSWREILREARRALTSTYEFSLEEAYRALTCVYESLAYQLPVIRVYSAMKALLEGVKAKLAYFGRLPLPPHWADIALAAITLGEPIPITELGWDTS